MSYNVDFKGQFEYPNEQAVEQALKVIDQELEHPEDDFETNCLTREDFSVKSTTLFIDFSSTIPASCWYGCIRVLSKMSTHAIEGQVKGLFEGDEPEWISAGDGY